MNSCGKKSNEANKARAGREDSGAIVVNHYVPCTKETCQKSLPPKVNYLTPRQLPESPLHILVPQAVNDGIQHGSHN